MDEEWARRVLDMEEKGIEAFQVPEDDSMSPLGYTGEIARLDLIADRVMGVRTAVQASFSERHQEPHFEPIKRPSTAVERERERRARKVLLSIEDEVFGRGLSLGSI